MKVINQLALAHLCVIGGKLVVYPSLALRVCTLILFRIRLMPSPSASSRAGLPPFILPLFGGWFKLGFLIPPVPTLLFDDGLLRSRGATLRFWALKYGYSCFRRTSTSVTLSSLGRSSTGVSLILSRLRCKSLSAERILGVELRISSKNSVNRSAARLYLCLCRLTFSCSSEYSVWRMS